MDGLGASARVGGCQCAGFRFVLVSFRFVGRGAHDASNLAVIIYDFVQYLIQRAGSCNFTIYTTNKRFYETSNSPITLEYYPFHIGLMIG